MVVGVFTIRSDRGSAHARIELQPIRSERIKFVKPIAKVMLMLGLNLNRTDPIGSVSLSFYQILKKNERIVFARLNNKASLKKNKF
ncbi:hypothetical protein Hanom_Chr01g00005841 [Helianthus anomalus]